MSAVQLLILVVAFAVLYKFVIPRLFPSAVSGGVYVVDPTSRGATKRKAKDDDDGAEGTANPSEAFVISGGGIGFVGSHRTQAKAQLRRRQAEEGKNVMA